MYVQTADRSLGRCIADQRWLNRTTTGRVVRCPDTTVRGDLLHLYAAIQSKFVSGGGWTALRHASNGVSLQADKWSVHRLLKQ